MRLNARGQEEGPFALLLAAVMLALLIPIVASLFTQMQTWECESRIANNVETLAREFELAASLGGGKRTVLVDLGASVCGNVQVDSFIIEKPDTGECQDACQTPHCRIVKAVHERPTSDPDFPGQIEVVVPPVCVRIPMNVELKTVAGGGSDLTEAGYVMGPGVHTLEFTKKGLDVEVKDVTPQ